MNTSSICLLAVITAAVPASSGLAVTRFISHMANGTGPCQAALPSFEGLIRKRPLAIQNEGTSTAFVNCSPYSMQNHPINATAGYETVLTNRSGANLTIDCTGVIGGDLWTSTTFIVKSVAVANNDFGVLKFLPDEVGTTFSPFNFQCALPPGTGISTIYTAQNLDVGM